VLGNHPNPSAFSITALTTSTWPWPLPVASGTAAADSPGGGALSADEVGGESEDIVAILGKMRGDG
jgi:hypothetical protein